ncbi:COP9 signalosome complex subunit 7b [Coemansia sp. Benny D115]|nr:COP9 signalosome complex subunit 7b [Coemansia sp. Benny D115]
MNTCLASLKTATTEAEVSSVVQNALADEEIFHFGRLLEAPAVANLAESSEFGAYWKLLNVFSFGTLGDYKAQSAQLPELTATQTEKLKYLTLVSLASEAKLLAYDDLMRELDCANEQEVENLVIETIYKKLLSAKLDQKRRLIEVDYVIGRDVHRDDLQKMHALLSEWSTVCEDVLADISESITSANAAAAAKKADKLNFTRTLQELRTRHAISATMSDRPSNLARFDSQYASSEYRREDKRVNRRGS